MQKPFDYYISVLTLDGIEYALVTIDGWFANLHRMDDLERAALEGA